MSKFVNVHTTIIASAFLVILILFAVAAVGRADVSEGERSFYFWVGAGGVPNFTDNPQRIPRAFADQVTERKFSDIDVRLTIAPIPEVSYRERVQVRVVESRAVEIDTVEALSVVCDGPIQVTQQREQEGDRNRLVYYLKDACGKVLVRSHRLPRIDQRL